MAQLRDTVVAGSLRATDSIYTTTAQFQSLNIPTSNNGTTYGPGEDGQILKSNGTSVYWANNLVIEVATLSEAIDYLNIDMSANGLYF